MSIYFFIITTIKSNMFKKINKLVKKEMDFVVTRLIFFLSNFVVYIKIMILKKYISYFF